MSLPNSTDRSPAPVALLTGCQKHSTFRRAALLAIVAAVWSPMLLAQSSGSVPAPPYVRFYSPTLGPANAKVHLVEFLDPACEGCRAFYPFVKAILAEYPNRVRLYIRYAAIHKGADFAVRALEAARAQDRYWQALDMLFARQPDWTRGHSVVSAKVLEVLATVPGLDIERLKRDMDKPEYVKIVEQDLADAKALKLMQTPTFYVNGKSLTKHGFDELRALVAQEVAAQYP